ncbi:substrate-binding periplasmic protein [Pseudodesulfovibrio tunisiensis]|uniref:substrate-binding periplasmic protein n=1 Tax=Pseudodesulfovibrio tunisiensis TaxID=463192 RepID=UPI001FB3F3B4|nr:transporter substrate-binding domain-containing protein [Pseudodesulfovibrio tunisiensis]
MIRHAIPLLLSLFAVLAAACLPAHAEERREVRLVAGEWPPYSMEYMPGNGAAAEIVRAALEAEDLRGEFAFLPWPRCRLALDAGDAEASFPWARIPTMEPAFLFSDPILQSRCVFFYRRDRLKDFDFTGLKDLKGYIVSGNLGYFYETDFRKADLRMDWGYGDEHAFRKLERGWVDLAPQSEAVGWFLIRKLFPGREYEFAATHTPLTVTTLHVIAPRSSPGAEPLIQTVNRGLAAIRANGTFARILERYGIEEQ